MQHPRTTALNAFIKNEDGGVVDSWSNALAIVALETAVLLAFFLVVEYGVIKQITNNISQHTDAMTQMARELNQCRGPEAKY